MTESIVARRYRESLDEITAPLHGMQRVQPRETYRCSLCGHETTEYVQPCPRCLQRVIWSLSL